MKNEINTYQNRTHHAGRLGTIIFIFLSIAIPLAVGFVYGEVPSLGLVLQVGGGLLLMYIPLSISEVISYAPVLGSGTYIAFITGNVIGIKLPVAINAMRISGKEQSTEAGDAVATLAIAISSIATMVIIAAGLLLIVPLKPILELPQVKTATSYMLPAMLGVLMLGVVNNKSGKYTVTNKTLSLLPCAVVMTGLVITHRWNPMYQGVFIVAMIPVTILTARLLYNRRIIKVKEEKQATE